MAPGTVILRERGTVAIVQGFTDVRVNDVTTFMERVRTAVKPVTVQFFDADRVAGSMHLTYALLNALQAFNQRRNLSKSLEVEVLLYASGQRQIGKAIEMLGLRRDTTTLALLLLGSSAKAINEAEAQLVDLVPGKRDDRVLALDREPKRSGLKTLFGVTDLELAALPPRLNRRQALAWLIVERGAILATQS
jgi:KEOPS complex subunit Cgi121